jgi:hypothetical protein
MRGIGPMAWRRIHTELARHGLGEPLAEHPALDASLGDPANGADYARAPETRAKRT